MAPGFYCEDEAGYFKKKALLKCFSSTVYCSGKIILDIAISLLMDYDICRRTVTGVAMSNGRTVNSEDTDNSCPSGSEIHGYSLG